MSKSKLATFGSMHKLLYTYNGFVIFILAVFMCMTQDKIQQSMVARKFLENVSAVPVSSTEMFWTSILSFTALIFVGWFYRNADNFVKKIFIEGFGDREKFFSFNFTTYKLETVNAISKYLRQSLFILEIVICMFLLRSLNLSYDGVVLLVVADLMYRYEGRNKSYALLAAMIGLYFIANYHIAFFQVKTITFEEYVAYYSVDIQAIILALKNVLYSVNSVIFVFYLVMLLKSKHEEKERIRLLNERLEEANQRLRAYAIEVEQMAETRERNRLAREIHDTLGHSLTGIISGLDACMMTLDIAPDLTKQQLQKIRDTAAKGIKDVRRSVKKLRPDDLERLPFQEALMQMTKDYSASSGMEIAFDIFSWSDNLRQDQEDVIYRVLQECLTNSNRHGHATKVKITIGSSENYLVIVIADNGEGCENVKQGFGLKHMSERLRLIHGTVHYWSDAGFIVEAMIPLNWEAENDKSFDS